MPHCFATGVALVERRGLPFPFAHPLASESSVRELSALQTCLEATASVAYTKTTRVKKPGAPLRISFSGDSSQTPPPPIPDDTSTSDVISASGPGQLFLHSQPSTARPEVSLLYLSSVFHLVGPIDAATSFDILNSYEPAPPLANHTLHHLGECSHSALWQPFTKAETPTRHPRPLRNLHYNIPKPIIKSLRGITNDLLLPYLTPRRWHATVRRHTSYILVTHVQLFHIPEPVQ